MEVRILSLMGSLCASPLTDVSSADWYPNSPIILW